MRIAYFDCFSGAAGDMIVGACLDAGADEGYLRGELGKLGLAEVELRIEKVVKNGFSATSFNPVPAGSGHHEHGHEQGGHEGHLPVIVELIKGAGLSAGVKERAIGIFERLAEAEARVHGTTVDQIHFHEVGAADAIMDIVGACVALESLGVEKVLCSAVAVGSGTVRCEHGVMPVPAPATAELLKGVDVAIMPSEVRSELLTPTGAAVLTSLAEGFGAMPAMSIEAIGYGAGRRDFGAVPNVLRLMIGAAGGDGAEGDQVVVLEANIDDATGELIGHVTERLMQGGALDVFCSAIAMKKNRPGTRLSVICRPGDVGALEEVVFRETTTFGVRRHVCQRSTLAREVRTVATDFGAVKVKLGYLGGELVTCSPEFSDCQRVAGEHGVAVKRVVEAAAAAGQKMVAEGAERGGGGPDREQK